MTETNNELEKRILDIVHNFLEDLENERALLRGITIHSELDRDLGIDSLGKVELFHRIEAAFMIQLQTTAIIDILTLTDLKNAIIRANPPQKISHQTFKTKIKKAAVNVSDSQTLVDVLLKFSSEAPDRPHIFFQEEPNLEKTITYGNLYLYASQLASGLLDKGIRSGDTVAIMLPTSEDFFYSFFGILLAGAIPVPIYPPFRPDKIEEYVMRESAILNNAETRILITFNRIEILGGILKTLIPSLQLVAMAKDLFRSDVSFDKPKLAAEDIALIQYTSGSTGIPKGVQLSHANLLSNIRSYGDAVEVRPTDVVVSWLPLYHDMGLIGAWLGSLYYGLPLTIMSPLTFIVHPERWLWAIHYHRATLSAAPNFAYELCLRKIPDALLEGLDLSSWRVAANGAEAVYPETLRRFIKKFKPYGFKAETLLPVYGLAESTVALLFPPLHRPPLIDRVERESLETKGAAIKVSKKHSSDLEFVSCGTPITGNAVRIVNEQDEAVDERIIGFLQFTGTSAMQGYHHNPEATRNVFHEGWWDTGDLAYQADGEIFITGRKKDLIIKAGRNLYPESIEAIAAKIDGVRKGCVVAFSVSDLKRGTEKLIIVAESRETEAQTKQEIADFIGEKVLEGTGVAVDHVIIAAPHTVAKTSSGKLRRSTTKEDYIKGKLGKQHRPIWLQFSKLFLSGGWRMLKNGIEKVWSYLFTAYVGFCLFITVIPVWLLLLILPQNLSRRTAKRWFRIVLALAGCRIKVKGRENIRKQKMIYVANHASYIDAMVIATVLPETANFVGKRELLTTPIVKTFFNRLGQLTVDRMDFSQSVEDTKKLKDAVNKGKSLVIFPEGTFTYASGLRPFKLGAFQIAVETKAPICPIALKGTRAILRSGSWLIRPGKITVTVCPLIHATGEDFTAITHLKSLTRTEIAKHCGEFPIDLIATTRNTQ